MIFSTYIFLVWFLPIFLVAYYATPVRWRALCLTFGSYVFYGWFRPEYCALLAGVTILNFYCGSCLCRADTEAKRKLWVTVSVAGSLGVLGFFKYSGMLSTWADNVARLVVEPSNGGHVVPIIEVLLPIGISFFTFQAISYTVDLYRGAAPQARGLIEFASYISMFPQLIAGPIVRYKWISEELQQRDHTPEKFCLGIHFFILGLAKKVLVADLFALGVPAAFGPHDPSFAAAWTGVFCYTLQIYFDFSAYSDMAVGLGLFLGFTFPQNFNSPYKSTSITEFWRRWHISLSAWLRDYLYVPLGGNRRGTYRTYVNLMLVMLLGGLWHGASIIFVIWGLWHGVLLALERAAGPNHPLECAPRWLGMAITNLLVMIGWVFFRAEDLPMAGRVLRAMFLPGSGGEQGLKNIHWLVPMLIPVGMLACWTIRNTWESRYEGTLAQNTRNLALLVVSVLVILSYQSSPFLYFQF